MTIFKGKGACRGIAFAPLRRYERADLAAAPRAAADVRAEHARFEQARAAAAAELDELALQGRDKLGEENAFLFEVHRMMLEDEDYLEAIRAMILEQNTGAEYAVSEAGRRFSRLFAEMDDEYMQARSADVEDVSRRVLRCLVGRERQERLAGPAILFSDDFSPSETARFDPALVRGIVTEKGSLNSHTAIFARTMGIPAVVGVGETPAAEQFGLPAIVDGREGALVVDPSPEINERYLRCKQRLEEEAARLEEYRGRPTRTADGRPVRLYANISGVADAQAALENDAEGIGLFRSEGLFLGRSTLPDEEEQYQAYAGVVRRMAGRPVIIRTLDVGADKKADCLALAPEENPALGLRAVRVCLRQPELLDTQLRAILRASALGPVSVMVPMIASLWEVRAVRERLDAARSQLEARGAAFDPKLPLGIMVETPAAALISDRLAPLVDFFSIGTNDLTQYVLAADRMNSQLADYYDPRHPAVLELIGRTAHNAHRHGIWVGVCGELAAEPDMTRTLLELGVDELSVPPASVLGLRRAIAACRVDRGNGEEQTC